MADLIINGIDIEKECSVTMGDKFIEELLKPCSLKNFVENKDRSRNGKLVSYNDPRLEDRDLTLAFNIHGADSANYIANYRNFCALLQQGAITLEVPEVSEDVYHLTYLSAASFAISRDRTASTLSVKFNEPDPSNRAKTTVK